MIPVITHATDFGSTHNGHLMVRDSIVKAYDHLGSMVLSGGFHRLIWNVAWNPFEIPAAVR